MRRMTQDDSNVATLITTKPEAEIAADLKRRLGEALAPVCALIDEAAARGMIVQWDGFGARAPLFRHEPLNLRIVKQY